MKKRNAFTLAEVLITLGIIGVVAAMTLPTLIQKYQDKSDYTHLKKIYSQLLQATLSLEQEYGPVEGWEWTDDHLGRGELLHLPGGWPLPQRRGQRHPGLFLRPVRP